MMRQQSQGCQSPTAILRIKAQVRQRDGYRCVGCGLTNADHVARHEKQLHVHRIQPGSLYSADPGVCETVCFACHGARPKRAPGVPDLARSKASLRVRIDRRLCEVIRRVCRECRWKFTALTEIAFEKLLSEMGEWPPND